MTSSDYALALLIMQKALEDSILAAISEFERRSGMRVHSIKLFPGELHNGRRMTEAVEVAAQLR